MASSSKAAWTSRKSPQHPGKIIKVFVDPAHPASPGAQARQLANGISVPASSAPGNRPSKKHTCYMDTDARWPEINPLILKATASRPLDARFFGSRTLYRHPSIVGDATSTGKMPTGPEASKFDLAYISLDGSIGLPG